MPLSFEDAEIDRLARQVAKLTARARRKRFARHSPSVSSASGRKPGRARGLAARLDEIALESASLPDYDTRTPEEIIGYDEYGVPR